MPTRPRSPVRFVIQLPAVRIPIRHIRRLIIYSGTVALCCVCRRHNCQKCSTDTSQYLMMKGMPQRTSCPARTTESNFNIKIMLHKTRLRITMRSRYFYCDILWLSIRPADRCCNGRNVSIVDFRTTDQVHKTDNPSRFNNEPGKFTFCYRTTRRQYGSIKYKQWWKVVSRYSPEYL